MWKRKGKVEERSFLPFISVSYENVLLPVISSYLIPMGFFIILTVKVSQNTQGISYGYYLYAYGKKGLTYGGI